MYTMLLLTALAQPPKMEQPKARSAEPSKLGPANTAFPDLKRPEWQKDGKLNPTYNKERHDLVFKDILPELPKDASPLQKVHYEQARSGILYLQEMLRVIDLGRWDAAYYNQYLNMSTQVHLPVAELYSTSQGRIRCYEARVILLKDAERFIQIRVDMGNQAPQDAYLARFCRLQAEADLLKLKESLKDKK